MGICKLCRQERHLQRSHLIPRAFYNLLRTPGLSDPSPIVADSERTRASQEQLAQPLLCTQCEGLLNRNGEQWVLAKTYRLRGPSPLYVALSNALPDPTFGSGTVYSALSVPDININRLVYFGTSIFWRASIADWTLHRKPAELMRLGSEYNEQFRQYLTGEAEFPSKAVLWVAVVRSEHPSPVIAFPVGERDEGYHRHTFDVLGLSYILYVGSRIPKELRRFCAVRSPERFIFFTDINPIIDRNFRKLFKASPPSSKLAALREKDLSELPKIVRDQMDNLNKGRGGNDETD
jgi:hypothetical protein